MGQTFKRTDKELRNHLRQEFFKLTCIVVEMLHDNGHSDLDCETVLREVDAIWKETGDKNITILQLCEDETGYEMRLDGDKSYHEYGCLNFNADGGIKRSYAEQILIMNQRKKWIPTMYMASLITAIGRVTNMDDDGIRLFAQEVDRRRKENKTSEYHKAKIRDIGLLYLVQKRSKLA